MGPGDEYLTLASSRALLSRGRFFSGGWWRCRRFSAALGAFLAWWWLLPRWDSFCAWSVRWYNRLLLYPSFYAFSRFRSGGGAFLFGTSSKQPDCERNYYECEQNANPQPHTFAVSSSFALLGACGSSESSGHALGTSFVASLTKFYCCLFQPFIGRNTSTPPLPFWVRWQECRYPRRSISEMKLFHRSS
jgi:hypothetical protein